jgi:hypothetical protein
MFTNSSVNYYGFQMDKYEFESADMPAAGVTVTLQPDNKTTETASDGTYSFDGLEPGRYTVTPLLQGEKFTPSNQTLTLTWGEYRPGVDFAQDRR